MIPATTLLSIFGCMNPGATESVMWLWVFGNVEYLDVHTYAFPPYTKPPLGLVEFIKELDVGLKM